VATALQSVIFAHEEQVDATPIAETTQHDFTSNTGR
jgi:hypothetical protein